MNLSGVFIFKMETAAMLVSETIGHFRVTLCFCFKTNLAQNFLYDNEFNLNENELTDKMHFHNNGFTRRLVLTQGKGNSEVAYSVGVKLFFFYVNTFLCSNKFAWLLSGPREWKRSFECFTPRMYDGCCCRQLHVISSSFD